MLASGVVRLTSGLTKEDGQWDTKRLLNEATRTFDAMGVEGK